MKKVCALLALSGAAAGMMIGAACSLMTAAAVEKKLSLCDVVRSKAKNAFSGLVK